MFITQKHTRYSSSQDWYTNPAQTGSSDINAIKGRLRDRIRKNEVKYYTELQHTLDLYEREMADFCIREKINDFNSKIAISQKNASKFKNRQAMINFVNNCDPQRNPSFYNSNCAASAELCYCRRH